MTTNTGTPFSQCLCCTECQDTAKDFQKIIDLKKIGLVIYRHMVEIQNKNKETEETPKLNEDIFIIENTKDVEITPEQYLPEIELNKLSCPRCRKIVEHAQRLLHTIPNIEKNLVRGICDHCLMEQKSCYECEKIIQKFLTKVKELPENTKNFIKQLVSQVKHVLNVDDTVKDFELEKSQIPSGLEVDRLLLKSPKQRGERHVKQLQLPQTSFTQNVVGDDQILSLKEEQAIDQEVAHTQFKNLKEKRLRILESIPPVPISSKNKLLEGSFEDIKRSTRPKSQYYSMKPDDIDQLFGAAYKKNRESSLRKYHSDESLLTIAEVISKTDVKMRKDFSYFFPKKKKYVYPKRFASSSELIKETQDILQEKAEAERKKREEKMIHKLKIQENKKKARAERKAYHKEKLRNKEQSGMEPHMGELGQKRVPDKIKEKQELSTEIIKDDKSHDGKSKKKGMAPIVPKDSEITHDSKPGSIKYERQKDLKEEKPKKEYEEKMRQGKEQKQREKDDKEKMGKEKVDKRTPKEQKPKEKEERDKSGKGKVDERLFKEQKDDKEKMGKEKVDKRTPKEQKPKEKEEREKSGKGKVDERLSKEQKHKEDKVKSLGQQGKIEQKPQDKKVDEKQIKPDKVLKEKKETIDKSTETSAREIKHKDEKEKTKDDKGKDEKEDSANAKGQQSKQDEKGKTTKDKEDLNKDREKIQKDAREAKETISGKEKNAQLGLGLDKQQKEKEKYGAEQTTKQKDDKLLKDQDQKKIKENTPKRQEEEIPQQTEKIQRDERDAKENIASKAQDALLGLGKEKNQDEKDTKKKKEKEEDKSSNDKTASSKAIGGKSGGGKGKKRKEKLPKKKLSNVNSEKSQDSKDIAPKTKHDRLDKIDKPEKDLAINKINVRRPSPDDLILRLVRLKAAKIRAQKPEQLFKLKNLGKKLKRSHKPHKTFDKKCLMCIQSDLEFEVDDLLYEKQPGLEEIIIGTRIYKYTPNFFEKTTLEEKEAPAIPLLFNSTYVPEGKINESETFLNSTGLQPSADKATIKEGGGKQLKDQSKKTGKQAKISASAELEASKGIIHYTLSDRSFIEKGWTMLPTEKIVRKMNVYRMRPAQPEFDWFEHNKDKGQMTYDTGEILAEFDDNGRGRWYYRNGRLALDYYDAEELNANQRFVVWSSGEPDGRGRAQPYTILATFDYLGNGIVFDHSGKIRLKYNQTEGIVLDRQIGPVSHWKWHTLNDPPVLQQVMIDTQMAHKDQNILKLGMDDDKSRPDNEDMLAIEFENFIKEKSKKLTQSFKPFQIKMKALKINENFSLKVMDQASVYLIYRDGTTNLKLNIGMVLDHKEIVDTDTADVGEVSINNMEKLPARTDSLAALQKSVAYAQCFERMRSARERRLRLPQPEESADKLTAAASRPLRLPLRSIPSDTSTTVTRTGYSCSRKPTRNNIYYDNRLF